MSEHSPMTNEVLLAELEPEAEKLYQRHLETAEEWFHHEFVPWSRGRDFDPDEPIDEAAFCLKPGVQAALFLNILTEDNLPHYYKTLTTDFGNEGVWGEWNRRWTAEEGKHSIVLRDYVTVSRNVNLRELERARMRQVSTGIVPTPGSLADGLVYVALQELATRISHRNTGKLLDDPQGFEIMKRVAADENLHHLFYRDLVTAALKIDPSGMVAAIERQVSTFEMPGTGVEGYDELSKSIAGAHIYDLAVHANGVVVPVVTKHWQVDKLEGLHPEAEADREALYKRIGKLVRVAGRISAN